MPDIEFWSNERTFGFKVPAEVLSQVLELSHATAPEETGGILAGYYTVTHNCAVVTQASSAPSDSHSGKTFFVRGTAGLQRWLNKLWYSERRFYLGNWHSHLGQEPRPSLTDVTQLEEIAHDEQRKCPEPVLLLVGGGAADARDVKAYVFRRGKGLIELHSVQRYSET